VTRRAESLGQAIQSVRPELRPTSAPWWGRVAGAHAMAAIERPPARARQQWEEVIHSDEPRHRTVTAPELSWFERHLDAVNHSGDSDSTGAIAGNILGARLGEESLLRLSGGDGGPQADTLLLGRKTYEMFASFWPKAVESSKAKDPHGGAELSGQQRQMGNWLNEATKIVFSKTLKEASWKNTRIVRQIDPGEIKAMKKQAGKNMLVHGRMYGATLLAIV
jgi:hypothetical protein